MFRRSFSQLALRYCFYYRHVGFLPHPAKVETGGEDAYLSMQNVQGVLDGVSWWRDKMQVDAGLYSAAVARYMHEYITENLLDETPASSFRLLDRGYRDGKHSEIQGTATALLATLQPRSPEMQDNDGYKIAEPLFQPGPDDYVCKQQVENPFLDIISVGDCSCMVLRNGKIYYQSEVQHHDTDFPFQLGSGSEDTPKDGIKVLLPVQKGDVIIMGSDGLFDNVYPEQIAEIVWNPLSSVFRKFNFPRDTTHGSEDGVSERMSLVDEMMMALAAGMDKVIRTASEVSKDVHCDSPYASECIENGILYEGGKPDDITALVSVIGIEDDGFSGDRFSSSQVPYPIPYRDWP